MTNYTDAPEAIVLEIQRMSTEDGPGLRTTVFLKGCPLHCAWCHNPESISPKPQLQWVGLKCIGCHTCLDICPNGALSANDQGIFIDRNICVGCGACVDECPSTALELLGQTWSLDDLVSEIVKDRAYFEKSGGGVTLGGGEPTRQHHFATAFLKRMKEIGLQTALDTCGLCTPKVLNEILPYADLVLFDLKEIDSKKHECFTGSSNTKILENLLRLRDAMKNTGHPAKLWIRTPIIPGATDRPENIQGIGKFIADNMRECVSRWELCAFNNLCRDKYLQLGLNWAYADNDLLERAVMENLAEQARNSGVDPSIVMWTGSTKMEDADAGDNKKPKLKIAKTCMSY